jgi:hypothetical protein
MLMFKLISFEQHLIHLSKASWNLRSSDMLLDSRTDVLRVSIRLTEHGLMLCRFIAGDVM